MKHLLVTGLLFVGLSARVQAQTIQIGLRAGLNLSSASVHNADGIRTILAATSPAGVKINYAVAYHAGVLLSIGGPVFSVQPEILYSQYRIQYDGGLDGSGGKNRAEVKTNTIEVPILAKYAFTSHGINFFANAGPYVNYTLNGKLDISTGYYDFPQTVRFDPKSNQFAYGLTGGGGVTLPAGPGKLLLEIRYNYALRSRISQFNTTNDHVQLGMISVGYVVPLKH